MRWVARRWSVVLTALLAGGLTRRPLMASVTAEKRRLLSPDRLGFGSTKLCARLSLEEPTCKNQSQPFVRD